MTTVAEIESAIVHLPLEQVRVVATWLDEYQAAINAKRKNFGRMLPSPLNVYWW